MQNRTSPSMITELKENEVFVFGSNGQGYHCAGAAKIALDKFGATWGQAEGLQGQSYGINTMDGILAMYRQVQAFTTFASSNPDKTFLVTEIGCGIAGYNVEDVAPMFIVATAVPNIHLPARFWDYINNYLTNK